MGSELLKSDDILSKPPENMYRKEDLLSGHLEFPGEPEPKVEHKLMSNTAFAKKSITDEFQRWTKPVKPNQPTTNTRFIQVRSPKRKKREEEEAEEKKENS